MPGNIKTNPIPRKVHPDFWELIEEIQNEKVVQGIDKITNKTQKYMITKQISNLINANKKIKQMLIDVRIDNNGNST